MAQMKKTPADKKASATLSAKVDPSKKKSPKPAKPSTIQQIATRFNVTAREARDIAKAVGNVATSAKSATNLDRTGNQYLGKQALKESVKDLKKQVKETGKAAKTGTKGTRAGKLSYNTDTGTPQGLVGKQRPKYRGSLTQY